MPLDFEDGRTWRTSFLIQGAFALSISKIQDLYPLFSPSSSSWIMSCTYLVQGDENAYFERKRIRLVFAERSRNQKNSSSVASSFLCPQTPDLSHLDQPPWSQVPNAGKNHGDRNKSSRLLSSSPAGLSVKWSAISMTGTCGTVCVYFCSIGHRNPPQSSRYTCTTQGGWTGDMSGT